MPRKLLRRDDRLPYHLTARANNREHFHLPLERLWRLAGDECLNLALVYEVEFQAFVLMPNHFHMIVTVPQHDLGKVMSVFMASVTRTANLISGRSGHLFGGPYFWSLIASSRYFGHALKYVYRNPVRAKLCAQVEDYPFSTLAGLLGGAPLPFPIHFTRAGLELALPSSEPAQQVEWLNRPFPVEAESLIQQGLRKNVFDAIKDRKTRKPVEPLSQLL